MSASDALQLRADRFGSITIVTVDGAARLDATNADDFGTHMAGAADEMPTPHLLLNLQHVAYLSSAILTVVLDLNKRLVALGGAVRICGAVDDVRKVFAVTNLDMLFHCHEDWQLHVIDAAERFTKDVSGGQTA